MTPKQLKASILQLAIQGKLVPQDPNDEPASELLKRIEAAKNAKGAKKGKPLPPITDAEKPFNIPDSWVWVRLGEIAYKITDGTHKTPCYTDKGIRFVSAKDISSGCLRFENCRYISEQEHRQLFTRCNPEKGDLLVSKSGSIGTACLVDVDTEFSLFESLALVKFDQSKISSRYLKLAVDITCLGLDPESVRGVAVKHLPIADIKNITVPLPPFTEQQQIVAKVEALFKYVDECEDSRKQLAEKLAETLKRSVLQEAIQGRLVPQDPNDEPASELLKRIAAEREKQIAEKKIKKSKPLPPIKDEEKPFPIPDSWEWVRLGELVSAESGLSYKKEDLSISRDEMVRVLRGGNILDGKYVFKGDDVFIAKEFAIKRPSIKAFDFVLPAVTSLEHLGKTAFFEEDRPDVYAGGFLLMLHLLHQDKWIAKYLLAFFQSEQYHSYCKNIANKSGQAFYNLSREKLCLTPIPLPPLAEQKRIVAKVDSLLAKIEEVRAAVC